MTHATETIRNETPAEIAKTVKKNRLGELAFIKSLADDIRHSAIRGERSVRKYGTHAERMYLHEKTDKIKRAIDQS